MPSLPLLLSQAFNGLALGSLLALVSSGLTIILGTLGVLNFAHGALFMLGAYALFLAAWTTALLARRSAWLPQDAKPMALAFALLTTVQAGLGIGALMMRVPFGMAVTHQATAALVLASAVALAWRVRRP